MDYIVLDLEWNQAAYKVDEEAEIPFEIIEIGAVKLNSKCEKVDEFQRLIRPQVYPFLVRRTRELTGWTDEELDTRGVYFEDACAEFLQWCGKSYIFCVWGSTDLPQLERNMAYYDIKIPWKYPFKYLDVQKLYALQEHEGKVRRALEYVIEKLQIQADRPFHHAVDDAFYTGLVFQTIDRGQFEQYYSVDYYKLPKNYFEEATFRFATYTKYVSRRFALKEEAAKNRKVRETHCVFCKRRLKKVLPWFTEATKNYLCLGECPEHGLMRGRIRIKNTEDNLGYFAVRTIKPCTPEAEQATYAKHEAIKEKRKEKRKVKILNKRAKKQAALKETKSEKDQGEKE